MTQINKAEAMLYIKLAEFQQEMDFVKKGSKGYGYDYADYSSVVSTVRAGFEGKGLSFTHIIHTQDDNSIILKTRIIYADKEGFAFIESTMPLTLVHVVGRDGKNKTNDLQALGSGITYAKRYALQALTGLPTGDDDGRSANLAPPTPQIPVEQYFTTESLEKAKPKIEAKFKEAVASDPVEVAQAFKSGVLAKGFKMPPNVEKALADFCVEMAEKHNDIIE